MIGKRRRHRRALENLRVHAEEISIEQEARIAELSAKAASVGLKPLAGVDFVWVPEEDEATEGTVPSAFFTHGSKGEKIEFVKHELVFPIRNLGELATAVAASDALYSRTGNPVVYERHGIQGLVDFLQDSSGQKVSES